MIPADVRLYTWVDVEEVLLRAQQAHDWPDGLTWARAYWDGLTVGIKPGTREQVITWLSQKIEPRFSTTPQPHIILESTTSHQRQLPILVEETNEQPITPRFRPSLARPSAIVQPYEQQPLPPLPSNWPPVIAFHSFKGGVGRTLHALALALALAEPNNGARVLLVDGDMEAPGLTWLLHERFPNLSVSLADLLALVHGEPDPDAPESIALTADRVKDLLIDGVYILPSFRSVSQFTSLEIKPEHLIRSAKDPYILTTVLAKLGKALGVKAAIVDLRAGLSELSTGLLLDPRVYRVLTTTLSEQSLAGTCHLLDTLGQLAPAKRKNEPLPALIISQTPAEIYRNEQLLADYESPLLESIKRFLEHSGSGEEDIPPLIVTEFDSKLAVLPGSWNRLVDLIRKQGDVVDKMRILLEWLPAASSPVMTMSPMKTETLSQNRRQLAEFAEKMVLAETSGVTDFLAIPPLRRLASDFSAKSPVAVVVGAKGAGKTYTFLQFVHRGNWGKFVTDTLGGQPTMSATICPVLQSKNLPPPTQEIINAARERTKEELDLSGSYDSTQMLDYLRDGLLQNLHEGQWRERWLNMITWNAGFEIGQEDAGRRFIEHLRARKQGVIAVIDGLEDVFQDLASEKNQQVALRALLQEVPDWLEQQPSRSVGLLVFVRQDMVLYAIKQNPAQFLARFEPYALKWDSEESLRLAAWIVSHAQIPVLSDEDILELKAPRLVELLLPLWGRKLGSDDSREGRSAAWVIAALSDLKGQIQARDIVRFLSQSARDSISDTRWRDRLLAPQAVRNAVQVCGREKIKEIRQENPRLGSILLRLEELPQSSKQVPFSPGQVGLGAEDLKFLEDNGVVSRKGEEYHLSEIFRRGLDFGLKAGRSGVLALSSRLTRSLYE